MGVLGEGVWWPRLRRLPLVAANRFLLTALAFLVGRVRANDEHVYLKQKLPTRGRVLVSMVCDAKTRRLALSEKDDEKDVCSDALH